MAEAITPGTYDYNTTLLAVGCQPAQSQCYVVVTSNPQGCAGAVIYITGTSIFAQGAYSTAMAAYMAGKTVRVNYTLASTAACTVNLLATPQ
jgi:hypothetical protein